MLPRSENGRNARRRFRLPQLGILSAALGALVLIVIIGLLGFGASRESQLAATTDTISDSARLIVQLQRETLRLTALVRADPREFNADEFALQRSLLESRFGVTAPEQGVRALMPPEIVADLADIETMWADIQPMLDEWQINPENEELRADLLQSLVDMEFAMNAAEINYSRIRARSLNDVYVTSQRWFVALAGVSLLIVVFLSAVAFNIYRINQQRREAESAESAAREANRLKSEFLATMSHELRTPLNGVIGYADFLLESMSDNLDPRQRDYVSRILTNGERLLRLVDDILDVSRIEAGRIELVNAPFATASLLEDIEPQMKDKAALKGLAFNVIQDPGLPEHMLGDVERIQQIIINLATNAIKFTDTGRVELRLGMKDDAHWEILVRDTGVGIPAHAQNYIFEKFRQVDSASSRKEGGAGLGLNIVRNLAVLMGGSVGVESEPGKGSIFTVTLPLTVPEIQIAS